MKALLILNDPPYGSERSYNGLRLARALSQKDAEVTVFLMADAMACAKAGQKVPQGGGRSSIESHRAALRRHGSSPSTALRQFEGGSVSQSGWQRGDRRLPQGRQDCPW